MSDKPNRPTRSTGNSRSQRILDSMRVIATGVTHREGGGASTLSNSISSISLTLAAIVNKLRGITPTVTSIKIDSQDYDLPIQIPGPRGLRGINGTIGVNGKPGRPGFDFINDDNPIQNGVPGVRGPSGATGARGRSGAQAAPALDPYTDLEIAMPTPGLRGAVGATGATGSMSLISENLLLADAASVSFTNIPQNFRHLKIIIRARTTQAVAASNLNLQFNSDTAANYDYQQNATTSTNTTGGGTAAAQTSAPVGNFPGTSSTRTTQVGMAEVTIPHYGDATFEKIGSSVNWDINTNPTSANNYVVSSGFLWRSTSPITRIDVVAPSGSIKAGSIISVYGIGTGTAASSVTPVWATTINEDGSSLSNWTQTSGSWSVVSSAFHVDTGATTIRQLRFTSRTPNTAVVFEAQVQIASTGGFAADNRAGLIFGTPGATAGTAGSLVVLRSTGALTPASTGTIYVEQPSGLTAGPASMTNLFNLDTFYTLRVVACGPTMDVYVDGVYKYSFLHKVDNGTPAQEYSYVGLYAYNCRADFKNIKMYTPALPNTSAVTLKLDDCANPDDNTDLDASTSAHGLLKKLDGTATNYMNGSGAWSNPISVANISSSTYTPTLTNVANVTTLTPYPFQYMRVGNTVTVSGRVDMTPTAGGAFLFNCSLPVASSLSNSYELVGCFTTNGGPGATYAQYILAEPATDKALFAGNSIAGAAELIFCTFTYCVI